MDLGGEGGSGERVKMGITNGDYKWGWDQTSDEKVCLVMGASIGAPNNSINS